MNDLWMILGIVLFLMTAVVMYCCVIVSSRQERMWERYQRRQAQEK